MVRSGYKKFSFIGQEIKLMIWRSHKSYGFFLCVQILPGTRRFSDFRKRVPRYRYQSPNKSTPYAMNQNRSAYTFPSGSLGLVARVVTQNFPVAKTIKSGRSTYHKFSGCPERITNIFPCKKVQKLHHHVIPGWGVPAHNPPPAADVEHFPLK